MTSILGPGRFWSIQRRVFDALHPELADLEVLNLEDIAASLGNICRFGGHLHVFYSVADHSRFVARILMAHGVSDQVVFSGLVHDVVEIITGDVVSPMKPVFGEGLKEVERLWTPIVEKWFGLPEGATKAPEVKEADLAAYYIENETLRGWQGQHVDHLEDTVLPKAAMAYSSLWQKPLLPRDAGIEWLREVSRIGR